MSARVFFALGTASQVPTRQRNHNGYFIRWDNEGFLLDPGEGTQRQMIFSGVSASQITKIFITHFHGDHCLGLAGIIQRLSLDKVLHEVELYYPQYGQKYVDNLRNASVYRNHAKIVEKPFRGDGVIFEDKTLTIETRKLSHTIDSFGYRFQEKDSVTMLPEKLQEFGVLGKNIGNLKDLGEVEINGKTVLLEKCSEFKKGVSVGFVMDTRVCEGAFKIAENVDYLICEATYLAGETADALQNGHLTSKQAAEIAEKSNVGRLILTHFSQRYTSIKEFAEEARTIFADVVAVKDGEQIEILRHK